MRDDVVLAHFIRRVGPIVGKLCKTSKIYDVESAEVERITGDSSLFAVPPRPHPDVPVPPKIYFDSGEQPIRRPFKIPTKKPQFLGHREQGIFKVPTKIPGGSQQRPVVHRPQDLSVSPGSVHNPLTFPKPFQQGIPQLKHRGHKQLRKSVVPVPIRQEAS